MLKIFIGVKLLVWQVSIANLARSQDFSVEKLLSEIESPSLERVQQAFEQFRATVDASSLSQQQISALDDLARAFEAKVTPAELFLFRSRGPSWRQKGIDWMEAERDIYENLSYIGEDVEDVIAYCGFEDSDETVDAIDDSELEPIFKWNSVKKKEGSASIAYALFVLVEIVAIDAGTGSPARCQYPRIVQLFSSKLSHDEMVISYPDGYKIQNLYVD